MAILTAKPVVVPLDLSIWSLKALEAAASLPGDPASLHVVTVVPPLSGALSAATGVADEGTHRAAIGDLVRGVLAKRGLHRATVHVVSASGNAGDAICQVADDVGAQLIVLSSHGRTGLQRLAIGSVAERVVRRSRCPVLILKDAANGSARPAPSP